MVDIKRILCPTDFSEFSQHALDHAIALAGWYAAEITALHVATSPLVTSAVGIDAVSVPMDDARLSAKQRDAREAELEWSVTTAMERAQSNVPVHRIVAEGGIVDVILQEAQASAADLIVMGTHGRSGFERLLLGSVSERVVRKAPCPVLTVPRRAGETPARYKSILCPIDFSACSYEALSYALSLTEEADARLTVAHVVEYLPLAQTRDDFLLNAREFQASLELEAREKIRMAIPEASRAYCAISELVVTGKVYEAILRLAAQHEADLIVMGIRGRAAVDLMMFGSTTQHVMRQATCPVLSVRQRRAQPDGTLVREREGALQWT